VRWDEVSVHSEKEVVFLVPKEVRVNLELFPLMARFLVPQMLWVHKEAGNYIQPVAM